MKITIKEAREQYFRDNDLPLDGGYKDKWVPLKFWFITFYLYNSNARKKAVPLHDIHHVITGYHANPAGEAEISAWELAGGIHDKHFARFINLAAVFYGTILYPRRTFQAYLRGRHSNTLYDQEFSIKLLEEKLAELQSRLLPNTVPKATLAHRLAFTGLFLISATPATLAIIGLVQLVFL